MAGPKKMSVEEILAACRKVDSKGDGDAPPPEAAPEPVAPTAEAAADESAPPSSKPAATPKPAAGKDPKKMSVAEMMAAARAEKTGGAAPAAAAEEPAAKVTPAASGKKPSQLSMEEMLAAARAQKGGATKAESAAKATPKPAPKPKPVPAAAKGDEKAAPAGPVDTASILAAARTSSKRGPMSKAEAAAKDRAAPAPAAKKKADVPPMPEKPMYARPAPSPAPQDGRRGFLASLAGVFLGSSLAVGFSSLAVTNLLWVLGLARFMFPNILTEPPTKFKVGFPDSLSSGQVETKYKAQFGIWIVRYQYEGQSEIYALKSVCTHLGCTPNWLEGEQKFKCPCHGSGFYKDGINFEGPAPRPLERYAIRLADDGQLEVDKSRTFFEEKGDWKDPASYVPV